MATVDTYCNVITAGTGRGAVPAEPVVAPAAIPQNYGWQAPADWTQIAPDMENYQGTPEEETSNPCTIWNKPDTVAGQTYQFTAVGRNDNGNVVTAVNITFVLKP